MNKLCMNNKESNVMVIGSKWQLKSLNLNDLTISVDSDKLYLARQARYLGFWVRNDLSWNDHTQELCRKIYCYFHASSFKIFSHLLYFSTYIRPMYNQR